MKKMEFNMVPRIEDGHLELDRVPFDHGWNRMYATLTFMGNLATSVLSSTGLFETKVEAEKHLQYLEERIRKDVWIEQVEVRGSRIRIPRDGNLTLPLVQPARDVAYHILEAAGLVMGRAPYTGGCRTFYTPEEWKEKENYEVTNELLFICHDGGEFGNLCSYDREQYGLMEEFDNLLNKKGYYTEAGTNWWTAVYPLEKEDT